jgi:UDP-GlcNAc:undecaprenyl-phosphate GlcNAc-1-phosphate transferase
MLPQLLAILTALVASLTLTPAARRLAVHLGAVDLPGPRKVHLTPMPLWGGLAIYGAATLAVLLFSEFVDHAVRLQIVGVVAAGTLLVVVGSLDDRRLLHPQVKLMGAMPAAALILIVSGVRAGVFVGVFGSGPLWTAADLALTAFWVVGITAAFSILDHMDGLVAGIASIAAAFFLAMAVSGGQILVATLSAAVLGAAVGFLRWNFNPARIFMGDGGAMFLGFMMATLGLKLRVDAGAFSAAVVPLFVLAVPVFDTTLVTISRSRRGLVPFSSPGKDHTAHRLVTRGFSQRGAVLVMYGTGALGGVCALAAGKLPALGAYALSGAAVAIAAWQIVQLERRAFERQQMAGAGIGFER